MGRSIFQILGGFGVLLIPTLLDVSALLLFSIILGTLTLILVGGYFIIDGISNLNDYLFRGKKDVS